MRGRVGSTGDPLTLGTRALKRGSTLVPLVLCWRDMMEYIRIMEDLPSIPEHMVAEALRLAEDNSGFQSFTVATDADWGKDKLTASAKKGGKRQPKIELEGEIRDWVRANIADGFHEVSIRKTIEEGDHNHPHTDRTRNWVLIYLLEAGGDDHRTVFYESADQVYTPGQLWPDYEGLTEVASAKLPLNKWAFLSSHHPHSVENIPGCRIAIQVGFWDDPFQDKMPG